MKTNNIIFGIILMIVAVFSSCEENNLNDNPDLKKGNDTIQSTIKDTLRIGLLKGSTSYFTFRDEPMGYEYEMAEEYAHFSKLPLKIIVVNSEEGLIELLEEDEIDLAAYHFFESLELKQNFDFVFPQNDNQLVLVQNIGVRNVSNPIELSGKDVYVPKNSAAGKRMKTLNEETGGNINIIEIGDTLNTDGLINKLVSKEIQFTVTDLYTARLYKQFSKWLDINVPIGFKRKTGWMINKKNDFLNKSISEWLGQSQTKITDAILSIKYWDKNPYFASQKIKISRGAISPYDEYFKKYAQEISWDWRLLAAIAFNESGFIPDMVSWAGASGIMQLMPRTAGNFGLDRETILDPEKNIEAGVQYIKSLNLAFRRISNKDERIKFILAAYNSGPAHIYDAMKLAEKYGKNPNQWFDNVDVYLMKKNEPEFYNDSVVKFGRFRARETVAYVINTLETYEKYLGKH